MVKGIIHIEIGVVYERGVLQKMIITKTPFRMSFFGGGTDYPAYFKEYGGGGFINDI